MKKYHITYGGGVNVEAESEEEAYEQFYEIIRQRIAEKRLGLITKVRDV